MFYCILISLKPNSAMISSRSEHNKTNEHQSQENCTVNFYMKPMNLAIALNQNNKTNVWKCH